VSLVAVERELFDSRFLVADLVPAVDLLSLFTYLQAVFENQYRAVVDGCAGFRGRNADNNERCTLLSRAHRQFLGARWEAVASGDCGIQKQP
jgi:hypothetical protein